MFSIKHTVWTDGGVTYTSEGGNGGKPLEIQVLRRDVRAHKPALLRIIVPGLLC